uniref:Galactosyltransferase C-terminal domain-containing protein n=1 Tax=viral metagenome TaxID=1070528 RepID=A0A6C0EG39_9ZZZZ
MDHNNLFLDNIMKIDIIKNDNYNSSIPNMVFLLPYRDRENQKKWFIQNIERLANIIPFFEVYFIHQNDNRIFNRGAMKNLGFLHIKKKYPHDYKSITLIFHDVDTFPKKNILLKYSTHTKIVKHFYGFQHTLGGIVSIKGQDFEKINGFPNYWGWGFEDNVFQDRCLKYGLKIDRKQFYKINNGNIHHFQDERFKIFNTKNMERVESDKSLYGIKTLSNYTLKEQHLDSNYIFIVHASGFDCEYDPTTESFQTHDLAKGNVIMKNYKNPIMKMNMKIK